MIRNHMAIIISIIAVILVILITIIIHVQKIATVCVTRKPVGVNGTQGPTLTTKFNSPTITTAGVGVTLSKSSVMKKREAMVGLSSKSSSPNMRLRVVDSCEQKTPLLGSRDLQQKESCRCSSSFILPIYIDFRLSQV